MGQSIETLSSHMTLLVSFLKTFTRGCKNSPVTYILTLITLQSHFLSQNSIYQLMDHLVRQYSSLNFLPGMAHTYSEGVESN
jgi:CII-binding regulator of phage lambda lysogenization HflD